MAKQNAYIQARCLNNILLPRRLADALSEQWSEFGSNEVQILNHCAEAYFSGGIISPLLKYFFLRLLFTPSLHFYTNIYTFHSVHNMVVTLRRLKEKFCQN